MASTLPQNSCFAASEIQCFIQYGARVDRALHRVHGPNHTGSVINAGCSMNGPVHLGFRHLLSPCQPKHRAVHRMNGPNHPGFRDICGLQHKWPHSPRDFVQHYTRTL